MKQYFEQASAQWVRYSDYEWKKDGKGILYLTPAADAKPIMYDPLADDENPLRICWNCAKVYVAKRKDRDFCGASCRKQFDARKQDDTH